MGTISDSTGIRTPPFMRVAEFLLRPGEAEIRPPLGAALARPATCASWREEEQRLLDEDGDLEGF
ncbi:hypothetical protein ABZ372_10180 [Streptomyces sp. NPDC005921]|uniref:hypothetical protein n=1 Tax=Streptomyces sp. NPDC005827 TaxID=3157070 RepID=UPI0033D3ECD7